MHRLLLGCCILGLLLTITTSHSQPNEGLRGDLMLIGDQFREAHNEIHEIQMQATESEAVKAAQEEFSKTMDQAMLKADPEIEEDLKKSNALLKKVRAHPDIDNPQAREQNLELKKMLLDYRFLEQKLTPARKLAAEAPECKEKLENLEKVTMAEMKKINPDIQKLMDDKEELAARYRELRSRVK